MGDQKTLLTVRAALSAVFVAASMTPAMAQCELARVTASDGATSGWVGTSVSVSGDSAVVGAHGEAQEGHQTGAAYIFRHESGGWAEEAKLTASDAAAGDSFGWDVAISGDYAVVGAWGHDDGPLLDAGAAYVFTRCGGTWFDDAKLTPSHAVAGDAFGLSVSICGEVAVIGTPGDDNTGVNTGAAYIFRRSRNDWVEETKLVPYDASAGAWFGYSVSISGETVVVGAYFGDDANTNTGAAYVFQRVGTTWIEQKKLTSPDGSDVDGFGGTVSISGDTILVGAKGRGVLGERTGAVYIFRRDVSGWGKEARLTAGDAHPGNQFGLSISINGDAAMVGVLYTANGPTSSGGAYLFRRSGTNWSELLELRASDAGPGDQYGRSVSVSAEFVVVGAWYDNNVGQNSGSAYIYRITAPSVTNLLDFASVQTCFSGFGATALSPCCRPWDFEGDGDIDLEDFATFSARLVGP